MSNGITVADVQELQAAVRRGDIGQTELSRRANVPVTTINAIVLNEAPDPRIRTAEPLVRAFRELMAEKAAAAVAVVEPGQEKESA